MKSYKGVFYLERLSDFIVNQKKTIIVFYIVLLLLSLIGTQLVNINYDLSSYLPKELNSIEGKNILDMDFGIKGTANILIKNSNLNQVSKSVEELSQVEGVKDVVWLGSADDILKPTDFIENQAKEQFLNSDTNLIQVFFQDTDNSEKTMNSISKIKEILGEEDLIGGPASVSYDMKSIVDKEIIYYSIVAFIIISIILFLSLESFIEPILFFATIGVAVAINLGTNAFFSKVSYMTHSVAGILQLAVSMDYSIFLLHRYMDEKINYSEKSKAMSVAIRETFLSISSSSLTTVGGFLALVWMRYGIGKDMGLVLAKGVLFSLITVITLLPVLILLFDKQIEKYRHKVVFPNFQKLGPFVIKRRYIFLVISLIITIPAFLAQDSVEYYYSNEKTLPEDADSVVANKEIDDIFNNKNQLAIIVPRDGKLKELNLLNDLKKLDGVKEVVGLYSMVDITLPESFLPNEIKDNFLSESYSMINVMLDTPLEGDDAQASINNIEEVLKKSYDKYYVTGESAVYKDLQEVTSKDFTKVTIISIAIISMIIFIAFRSITIPIILVFIIQLGIWINLSIPYFLDNQLNFISFIIIGAIQLGATVDYAILYTQRFRDNLHLVDKKQAAVKTLKDTGPSILTSALILFTGTLSISFITSIKNTSELTMLIGRGALISLVLVLGVLPSMLIVFNRVISYTTIDWPKENNSGGF